MNDSPQITIVGSNNQDLITYMDRMPRKGETIFGEDFEMGFGGKGANQAVAAAKLGADVTMVTKVGNDLFGPETIKNFEDHGINTEYIHTVEGVSSGVAPIFVNEQGDNWILVVKGANDLVDEDSVDEALEHIAASDYLVMQLEIPKSTVYYAIDRAHERDVPVILNPAPADDLEMEKLRKTHIFAPNETELETLRGVSVDSIEDAEREAKTLVEDGVPNVLVTLGGRGSLLVNEQQSVHLDVPDVEPVDTTGAGDAFIGSLAVFLGEETSMTEAIRRASRYAALSTTGRGTQKSFLTREEYETEAERL